MATMDFGNAIRAMKQGLKVARAGWNGKGMWLWLVDPSRNPERALDTCRRPYIEMKDAQDMFVPWLASQTDVLAEDWVLVD